MSKLFRAWNDAVHGADAPNYYLVEFCEVGYGFLVRCTAENGRIFYLPYGHVRDELLREIGLDREVAAFKRTGR